MSEKYVDAAGWKGRWKVHQQVAGGAQGEAFIVRSVKDGSPGFLKVLKAQGIVERRARFAREAIAYDSLNWPDVPRLIETNAQHQGDAEFKLFMVTELIEGHSLAHHAPIPASIGEATSCVSKILHTLAHLHEAGIVHRDIKPDNIILRGGDIHSPVLVDLGLAFSQTDELHDTEIGQELGNRFLRLPELSAGSPAKQDPASDVTFSAGLFFYLLTNAYPFTLEDGSGAMPHQRDNVQAPLSALEASLRNKILGIFDRSFQTRVGERFQSAAELNDALEMATDPTAQTETEEVDLDAISAELDKTHHKREYLASEVCNKVIATATHAMQRVANKLSAKYSFTQNGYRRFRGGQNNGLGLVERENRSNSFLVEVEARSVGQEIIVTIDGEDVFRGPTDAFRLDELDKVFDKVFARAAAAFHRSAR